METIEKMSVSEMIKLFEEIEAEEGLEGILVPNLNIKGCCVTYSHHETGMIKSIHDAIVKRIGEPEDTNIEDLDYGKYSYCEYWNDGDLKIVFSDGNGTIVRSVKKAIFG